MFKYFFGYAFCIISLLYIAHIRGIVRKILCRLGDQSMNMWMIHTWLCYYLFHNFFYSFKYPIFIFSAVTIASYFIGGVVNILAKPIECKLMSKNEVNSKPIL